MGRKPKDGRFVNFLMDTALFNQLEQVTKVVGKTKTDVLEEALRDYIEPFCNKSGEIAVTEAVYVKTGKICKVIDTVTIADKRYCKIFTDREIKTVPERDVVL